MKYLRFFFFISLLLYKGVYANIDIRLTFVSNSYDNPSSGVATLVIDVEATSTTTDTDINAFQDAIEADANFQARIDSVNFSNELFSSSSYNTTESFSTPQIQFAYTYNSGTKSQILSSGWIRVVRITIQYNMINQLGSIIWSSSIPQFFVTNGSNVTITGTEQSIPSTLTNFPLPVELTSFTATANQNGVNLKWQTKTEVNNYGFEVERKVGNGKLADRGWEKIGFASGHGNSNSPKDYAFVDKNPVGGSKFIYRLKQIDNDGKFTYSNEVEAEIVPNEFKLDQNYPNPFNPATNIKFALPKAARVTLVVYNLLGEKVGELLNEEKEAGYYEVQFDGSSMSSGVYIFRLTAEKFVQTKKMTLIK